MNHSAQFLREIARRGTMTRRHFDGDPRFGAGMEAVYQQLHEATGKTISRVRFGEDPARDSRCHQGEYIVFDFSDGSSLEILTGSNGQDLADEHRGLKVSDIHFSYVALFHADGKASRPEAGR